MRPKSLRHALILYLTGPVMLLLAAMGAVGLTEASNYLLHQWRETTILRLQNGAYLVDARLNRAIYWLHLFRDAANKPLGHDVQDWLIQEAKAEQGIVNVDLELNHKAQSLETEQTTTERSAPTAQTQSGQRRDASPEAVFPRITRPRYDDIVKGKTVSVAADLLDRSGSTLGTLEVVVNFDYLLQPLTSSMWWRRGKTCLVDSSGTILAGSLGNNRKRLGDNADELELMTLAAMKKEACGTVRNDDYPSRQVISYCRLQSAPWSLVVMSPTEDILAPLIHFRYLYGLTIAAFTLLIALLIRQVTKGILKTARDVSDAARTLSEGHFDINIPVTSENEIGQLAQAFNTMARQLEERVSLRQALHLAMEVQRNLLPQEAPEFAGLDIAATSLYCEQTGGDYFDFLQFSKTDRERLIVAVGDVVGHGISAALLMTTVRGLLRGRLGMNGSLAAIVTDINRLLCLDTSESASFMTLFIVVIDLRNKELHWVRAGHDPAIVYDPAEDTFDQLKGAGMALGVDESFAFEENRYSSLQEGQVLLITTDGLWEAENIAGEQFGKERMKDILRSNAHLSSKEILQTMMAALANFRGDTPQADDVTLAVIKMTETK